MMNLQSALTQLRVAGRLLSVSSVHETEPIEFLDQPWFLNAAVGVETDLSARDLLKVVAEIESAMGRQRDIPKGPRTVDLDILLFDEQVLRLPDLTIPHPAMHLRRFVLQPLAEIAPQARHPILDKTVRQLLAESVDDNIVRLYPEHLQI